ncbi:MAG: archease [Methanothrix sp.]|jgi:SHS2 domain-containing protein|uniref:archease n=1 Tax=Methanothrix sp. TaxID=90426 RepID=UPI00247D162A|nr:archease [Methanothrix sp.]MDH7596626.1 archease [Methanothrix sp.]HOK58610.1 archease [Methanothrix sp.]HOL43757.1 archease [Methanothrix sp.]HPO88842.1 archease [Methanothrix sp.]
MQYEFLEHTADVKFRAYGSSPEEMLRNAALAMFSVMMDTATIKPERVWEVELEAEDLESLAYRWLSELLFLFSAEMAVFRDFDISLSHNDMWRLNARARGEHIDRRRHSFETEIKAVTLHQFEVRPGDSNSPWMMQVVLDV